MVLSRILGGIGRTMISAGVLILLFVVYQLWGTGLRTNASQNDLTDSFNALKAARAAVTTATAPASTAAVPNTPTTPAVPVTAPPSPPHQPGDALGRIEIPRIDLSWNMIEGVDLSQLKKGPGHFPETPLPGQAGNAAIAGHRTTWGAPFNRLDELAPGDTIKVTTVQGEFTYEVVAGGGVGTDPTIGHRIITPDQTEILDQAPGRNTITLMACHPKFDLKQRIVVVGRLITPAAPTTERAPPRPRADPKPGDLAPGLDGDLVGGDQDARTPAIMYGLFAGLIWLLAWIVARLWPSWRKWQRWAVFGAALPLFAVPVFLAFESINKLLPAGY